MLLVFRYALCFCLMISFSLTAQQTVLEFVNPFIGTGGHGHTFPGATMPFGMVQLSPDTRLTGWDGCSGYHYSDSEVYGFSHTHLSGTGVSDYGDILLMPYVGETVFNNGADGKKGYSSKFSKENEEASPGFYKTRLDDYNIDVELTCSTRAGLHKYSYPENEERKLIIDLEHRDKVTAAHLEIVSQTEVVGYRHSDAWARDQKVFFVMQFNAPIVEHDLLVDDKLVKDQATSKKIKASLSFSSALDPLLVRVGISAVDIEGARKNLESEISSWNFGEIKINAQNSWSSELNKIKIEDPSNDKKTIFYTALYHTMIAPNIYTDVDRRYRGTDGEIHTATDHTQYTIFSLWDTYRATHPLYTLIDQRRTKDFIKTFLKHYEEGGQLPMWELAGNYTGCMIGYHAAPVISDAFMKGIDDFDAGLALEAMISNAKAEKLSIKDYSEQGFLSTQMESESVSKTLEYAYDDWTIARMAEKMGRQTTANEFYKRAQYYKNVFDPSSGFMRARSNNRWFYPFDPAEVNFNYTEANAWQYSYYVPQDVQGWMSLLGGEKAAEERLDALFNARTRTKGRHQADITGLIGQYAHGNEPSHHIAYMYNYLGKPYKTQEYVRQIMEELYHNAPDGLSGNEDCGQMSAWLVMSALGFYPVAPGSNDYLIGSPWFDSATIQLENGNEIFIEVEDNSKKNKYIQLIFAGENQYYPSYFTHEMLMSGPSLSFVMGPIPQEFFGADEEDKPVSKITSKELVAVPALLSGDRSFRNSTTIKMNCATKDAVIKYQIDNGEIQNYEAPFEISKDCKLTTWAEKDGAISSQKVTSDFIAMDASKAVIQLSGYAPQYSAGGDLALIDRLRGGDDYRNGVWQGCEGIDLETIISLGKKQKVSEVRVGFLQDENAWIFMPTELEVYAGSPNNWTLLGNLVNDKITPKDKGSIVRDFVVRAKGKTKYIRIVAKNRGVCPSYHKGAGGKCWIFADEVIVK